MYFKGELYLLAATADSLKKLAQITSSFHSYWLKFYQKKRKKSRNTLNKIEKINFCLTNVSLCVTIKKPLIVGRVKNCEIHLSVARLL